MNGPWTLGLRHARAHPGRSAILALCVAVSVALPTSVRTVIAGFRAGLTARAQATPLVVGAKGNRFDLAMGLLYFRRAAEATASMADFDELRRSCAGVVIPVNLRFTARGRPIVATTPEYLELRRLTPAAGTPPLMLGDALLGARAARDFGVDAASLGAAIFSDQRELFDIAKPQALKLRVVGILPETGQPEDDAVIVDLGAAWILEGLSHAHIDPAAAPAPVVVERAERSVTLSEALIDANEVTPANAASFHLHARPAQLPVTGFIVRPASDKDATLLTSRINAGRTLQAAAPVEVVRDLLAYVLRVRILLDGVSVVVGGLTAVLLGLVTALSVRVRSREIETYRRIGVSRGAVAAVFISELLVLTAAGALLGLAVAWAAAGLAPLVVKLV